MEGAIESLNSAIDALNTLEDTKSAAAAAAERAAALVRQELAELDRTHSTLLEIVDAFLAARDAAKAAIEDAKRAESSWQAACAAEAHARTAKRLPRTAPSAQRQQVRRELEDATRLAKDLKRDARRTSKLGEDRAIKLGETGERLEQLLGIHVSDALRAHTQYIEQRSGLEQVLQHSQERLTVLEAAKEVASRGVGDAMGNLESLSNELHEGRAAKDGVQCDDAPSVPVPLVESSTAPGAAPSTPWQHHASWRASRDLSEPGVDAQSDVDSLNGEEWSEEDSPNDVEQDSGGQQQ